MEDPENLIGALALTAVVVWQVTGDGEALAHEGVALIALNVILAVVELFHRICRCFSLAC